MRPSEFDPSLDVRALPDSSCGEHGLGRRERLVRRDDSIDALAAHSNHLRDFVHADKVVHWNILLTIDNTGHYYCRLTIHGGPGGAVTPPGLAGTPEEVPTWRD